MFYDARALFCNKETHALLSFYVIFLCLSQMCDIALNKDLAKTRCLPPEHPRRCRHCTQTALLARLRWRHGCQDVLRGDRESNTQIKVKNVFVFFLKKALQEKNLSAEKKNKKITCRRGKKICTKCSQLVRLMKGEATWQGGQSAMT